MEDPKWLRIVTLGLVIAALAVGYLLFSGKFLASNKKITQQQEVQPSPQASALVKPSPSVLGVNTQPSPTSSSAYNSIAERNRNGVQTLPNTGFPAGLILVFSASALISGWSLRKFPR